MTQTYSQLSRQIADLQAQAETMKRTEVAGVVAKAKTAIAAYGLTHADLFGGKTASATTGKSKRTSAGNKAKPSASKSSAAKYADGKGGVWVGRGPRPHWLNTLLAAGAKLEDYLADKVQTFESSAADAVAKVAASMTQASPPVPVGRVVAVKKAGGKKSVIKTAGKKKPARTTYRDNAGNSWSGFGPRPAWLKNGIAGGKRLEDFVA